MKPLSPLQHALLFAGIVLGIVGAACAHDARPRKGSGAELIPSSKPKADYTVPIAGDVRLFRKHA